MKGFSNLMHNKILYSDEISWVSLFSNEGKYERMGEIMK